MYQGYSLTQESIAEELGVSEGAINSILKNSTHGKIEENFKPSAKFCKEAREEGTSKMIIISNIYWGGQNQKSVKSWPAKRQACAS